MKRCAHCESELRPESNFCGSCGQSVVPPALGRRELTVLFCQLDESASLASSLDPEDWREVVQAFQQSAEGAVWAEGGHVAQYLGDGLLVYFGYPATRSDDPDRAVRAGLGIVAGLADVKPPLEHKHGLHLATRVGIHTGPVVVGAMGAGICKETLAVGETTNIAARLQDIAGPDRVVISSATFECAAGRFPVRDLGDPELRGIGVFRSFEVLGPEPAAQSTGVA